MVIASSSSSCLLHADGNLFDVCLHVDSDEVPKMEERYPPPISLPPKPKLGAPIPAASSSFSKPPPPPMHPSHEDEEEEEEDIYDDGGMGVEDGYGDGEDIYDDGGMGGDDMIGEELYDNPSEIAEEQAQKQASFAPPPPSSPPRSISPAEIEEDIYDMGTEDMDEDTPPLPARPYKVRRSVCHKMSRSYPCS